MLASADAWSTGQEDGDKLRDAVGAHGASHLPAWTPLLSRPWVPAAGRAHSTYRVLRRHSPGPRMAPEHPHSTEVSYG